MFLVAASILFLVVSITPSYAIESCNCIAFRLDDVQDYWLDDVQAKILDTFYEKNASLTAGIIANYFGHDSKIVDLVKERAHESPSLEIANHGWNHEPFGTFTEQEQWWLLKQANQKIESVTGVEPSTFIAPYDSLNNDTFMAAKENGLVTISANETSEPGPYSLHNQTLNKFPYVSQFGDVNKNFTAWVDYNSTHVRAEILRGMIQHGWAVVVLHPQDFAIKHGFNYSDEVNATRIEELEKIIDEAQGDNLKIVTLSEIPSQQMIYEKYPSWVATDAKWDSEDMISSAEFENIVTYLHDSGLLTLRSVSSYPIHPGVSATYFWVGEPPSADNQYISNLSSAWDSNWVTDFGGVDNPKARNGFMPDGFTPNENPFYVALPYNDFGNNGSRNPDAASVYWFEEKNWPQNESMVKNRWVEITKGDKTAYAQWEDVGPFLSDDIGYVFGGNRPGNTINQNAGIDLSPSTWDYLGLNKRGIDSISWKFVDLADVPNGPWKKITTHSQVNWSQ
ncbi:MAG TPA: polysaccharide deacetylase family protein [Candidatus Nitrosotalea sp.]|nr:polysaccharide deacetylase family protein [Candidatus Nitrosotalea sp.]